MMRSMLPRMLAALFIIQAIVVAIPCPAAAQSAATGTSDLAAQASDTLRVSLDDCIRRSLSVGEEVREAEATRATAQARYVQARSTVLPQLTFNGTYTRQITSIFGGEPSIEAFSADTTQPLEGRVRDLEQAMPNSGFYAVSQLLSSSSFASKNSWNAALNLRQRLFQGGSIIASIHGAHHALLAADDNLSDQKNEVTSQARSVYLNALLAERGVRIATLALDQADTQLQRARLRQESGEASEFELLQFEVARDNQLPLVKAALSQRELAELDLRRLANLPQDIPIVLTTPLLDDSSIPANPPPVDTTGMIDDALQTSGIAALENIVLAREQAVSVAGASYFPDVSLFGDLSQQAFPLNTLPTHDDWRRSMSVGVAASWTLFDGLNTPGMVQEAKATLSIARQELYKARELARLAVVREIGELDRATADLQARSHTVQLAKRALELASLRYDEGASTTLEVTSARLAWQLAQVNEAQARHDYFIALALLERFTGRPLFFGATPASTP